MSNEFEPLQSLTAPAEPEAEPEVLADPEIAADPPAAAAPAPAAAAAPATAVPPSAVDLAGLAFGPLAREGRSYVARLAAPLLVVTPPCALASPLVLEDGSPAPFVWLRPPPAFAQFAAATEARLLQAALDNKVEWLRKDVPDEALARSFKSFLRAEDGALRVKLADVQAFDAGRAPVDLADVRGPRVRAVLGLRQLTFGKTEFGGMWRLAQVLDVPDAPCLFQDDPDDDDVDSEIDDFV